VERQTANHPQANAAKALIEKLQSDFVTQLSQHGERLSHSFKSFTPIEWLRDEGVHGGGVRYIAQDSLFNRASVNMSQVFYEDNTEKPLNSATALSCIIHPSNPRAPSIHMHISWTHLKTDAGYWRIMADLNPSIPNQNDKQLFADALRLASGKHYQEAANQGDRYFYIPALKRHRGISHFYLEQFDTGDWQADSELAERFGTTTISTYCDLFSAHQQSSEAISAEEQQQQLDYHTLYFLQVLTLDRGTTSGLLAHGNNDVGILGSLPRFINRELFASWKEHVSEPQPELINALHEVLPAGSTVEIDDAVKQQLANAVRTFYRKHPQAMDLQARGNVMPPTVKNHKSS